jgi:hypothetical protein
MSEIVRRALVFYFERRESNTAWIGSLKPQSLVGHASRKIRSGVAAGRRRKAVSVVEADSWDALWNDLKPLDRNFNRRPITTAETRRPLR